MGRELRIIHTADWHLSSSLRGTVPELRRALIRSQEAMLAGLSEACRREQAAILLLAGDIFDSPEPDVYWLRLLQNTLAALAPMRVFITPGNHDPYFSDGLWQDGGWPDNVHIFTAEAEVLAFQVQGFALEIAGRGFGHFSATESLWTAAETGTNISDKCEADSAAPSTLQDQPYRILLLHGEVVGEGSASRYNPIRLSDPAYAAFDYLALGHVHQALRPARSDARKFAAYPGVLQGRGFDECGHPSLMLGVLREEAAVVSAAWRPLLFDAGLLFMSLNVDVSDFTTLDELLDGVDKALRAASGLSADALKKSCWRIELRGAAADDLVIAPDFLAEQLRNRGVFFVRLYDRTHAFGNILKRQDQGGFTGLLYKRYHSGLGELERNKNAAVTKEFLEKVLNYALAAHDGRLSEERLLRGLAAYRQYEEGVAE